MNPANANFPGLRIFLWSLLFTLWTGLAMGQDNPPGPELHAHNGWHLSPHGRLHVLVIFAEIQFDSTWGNMDPTPPEGKWQWSAGKLPDWRDDLFDPEPNMPDGKGYMTKYFNQASFGTFQVTGDYINQVISVPLSQFTDSRGNVKLREPYGNGIYRQTILRKVNEMDGLQTAHGSKFEDFDHWTMNRPGIANLEEANQKYDMVMLIWRNIHVRNLGDNSGFANKGSIGTVQGHTSDSYAIFRASSTFPAVIMRHEFSHLLYGGNNFHTASGGVGARTWMSSVGGWSNMSNGDCCSHTWNAWDRERMGWKNPKNTFLINAKCAATGEDISGNLVYGEPICEGEIVMLRDFVTHGDVIKIPLPHIPEGKKQQYLWLENHQNEEGKIDHKGTLGNGLYAFIQAGKDQMSGSGLYGGPNNYTWPLVAAGNYDFTYIQESETFNYSEERANPFTGYHLIMRHPFDVNGDGQIKLTSDAGSRTEYLWGNAVQKDGVPLPEDYFTYRTCPIFGVEDVAFNADRVHKIGLSYNPAATNLYTFNSPGGPRKTDVRRIYLNGISVEIVRQDMEGNLYLRIRWDDFDIVQDLRWCGNILSQEKIHLLSGRTIELDQGWSPQVPKTVQQLDGKNVFARPTILELAPGSELQMEQNSRLIVKKGSTLLVREGASVIMEKKAKIEVEPGAYVYLEKGAKIDFRGRKSGFELNRDIKLEINPLLEEQIDAPGQLQSIPRR